MSAARFWPQFVLPGLFAVALLVGLRSADCFQFNPDEGVNVCKAMLIEGGYRLYDDVWSDQPPLFSQALAVAFRHFGFEVNVARTVVVVLSALLLWAVWSILSSVGGLVHAAAGCLIVVLLPHYVQLSASAMPGLPSLALAMLALAAICRWHRKRQWPYLVASAALLAASVLTKLFTIIFVPACVTGVALAHRGGGRQAGGRGLWSASVVLWLVVFGSVAAVIFTFLVGFEHVRQLMDVHRTARSVAAFRELTLMAALARLEIVFLAILAGAGSLSAMAARQWLLLYPFAWAVLAVVSLLLHRPVWYHQTLLITVPAAVLAGYAVGEAVACARRWWRTRQLPAADAALVVTVTIAFALFAARCGPAAVEAFEHVTRTCGGTAGVSSAKAEMLAEVQRRASRTRWMVTDLPMFAFRAGVGVPPSLAVLSQKRVVTGALTELQVLDVIAQTHPEQILLGRFQWPALRGVLDRDYQLAFARSEKRLYVRRDVFDSTAGEVCRGTEHAWPQSGSVAAGPIGFASLGSGTAGGAGGEAVGVSGARALLAQVGRREPLVIRVAGDVVLPGGMHPVASDKTIVGVGSTGGIGGGGLRLDGVSNVIIRNLAFAGASEDAIEIRNGSHHVWIDHCDLSSAGDGLIDIKTQASEITVSWNRFSSHRKTSLVGHDDSEVSDIDRLRVTYHHNWFDGTFSRHPRVRFGQVHVFNNYFVGNEVGVASTCEAAVVVEANYFLRVRTPTTVGFFRSPPGDLVETGNVFLASGNPQRKGRAFDPRQYYPYGADEASCVPEMVLRGAGVGRVDENGRPVGLRNKPAER